MTRGQDAVALAEALRHLAKALTPTTTTATITTSATVVAVTLGPPALATDNGAAGASPLVLVASASPSEPVERTAPVTSATEPAAPPRAERTPLSAPSMTPQSPGETSSTGSLVPAACDQAVAACRDVDSQVDDETAAVEIGADG